MIVDSSAIVAIVFNEPTADALLDALTTARQPRMSAASLLETSIVIDSRRNPIASRRLDDLTATFEVAPVTEAQARIARQAYRDYGRGSGHPAQLNFGDCFSYALTTERREPLLYVGNDFVHTDLTSALGE